MAIKDIGALRGADETLNHQIVDTFATVAQADHVTSFGGKLRWRLIR